MVAIKNNIMFVFQSLVILLLCFNFAVFRAELHQINPTFAQSQVYVVSDPSNSSTMCQGTMDCLYYLGLSMSWSANITLKTSQFITTQTNSSFRAIVQEFQSDSKFQGFLICSILDTISLIFLFVLTMFDRQIDYRIILAVKSIVTVLTSSVLVLIIVLHNDSPFEPTLNIISFIFVLTFYCAQFIDSFFSHQNNLSHDDYETL